eukprot:5919525-Pleurochrysis_carterae.AAC.1
MLSPMRSRRNASDARAAPRHRTLPFCDRRSLPPPPVSASWWRRRMIEKAVALEMGCPSSSPPAGASSRR